MRGMLWRAVLAAGLCGFVASCGNNSTPTTPTTPSATTVTETFSGELTIGQTQVHTFTVKAGVVTATLTSLSPLSTAALGMSLGVWDGTNCGITAINDASVVSSTVTGTAAQALTLCLRVYDVGNIPDGTTYSYTAAAVHY